MRKLKFFTSELSPDMDGMQVRVAGWVVKVRSVGKIIFVVLRDREGEVQVIFKQNEVPNELFQLAKSLTSMSAIVVDGILRKANTKEGFEIVPKNVTVVHSETPLPIDVFQETTELSKRINYRSLDLRVIKHAAIFRLRSIIVDAFREILIKNGFVAERTYGSGTC